MTNEEKAKAYDKAVEIGKSKIKNNKDHVLYEDDIIEIFPELKESEDERIRKGLIDFLKSPFVNKNITDEKVTPWIAWLEKQGEQNTNEIHPIFRVGDYIKNKKTSDKVLIEQLDIATKAYCYVSYDGGAEIHSDFSFSKQDEWILIGQNIVEQKPTWSEEDEPQKELAEAYLAMFDKKFPILPTLKGKKLADYKNFLNKCQQIFGLKYWGIRPLQAKLFEKLSLLWATWGAEHLKGLGQTNEDIDNKNLAWSEEDERMFTLCASSVKTRYNDGLLTYNEYEQASLWLKSIKERYTWKPSEEQIKALEDSIEFLGCTKKVREYLKSLYQDLKRLREE